MRGSAGVTLVEVTVVVLVIGVAAAVAAPSLPELGPRRSGAVDAVVGVVKEARRTAARRGRAMVLELGPGGRYELRPARAPGASASGPEEGSRARPGPDRSHVIRSGRLRATVQLLPEGPRGGRHLRFGPGGRARGPDLRVRVAPGRWVRLTVRPWSGRVEAVR